MCLNITDCFLHFVFSVCSIKEHLLKNVMACLLSVYSIKEHLLQKLMYLAVSCSSEG